MSESGSIPPPPPDPSQGQAGWGAAPPPPPPGGSFGAPPPPAPGQWSQAGPAAGFQGRPYAEWPKRLGAYLIDAVLPLIAVWFIGLILGAISDVLGLLFIVVGYIAALGWVLYQSYLTGQTGQSFGKEKMKIRVLSETTGQPIGGGMGIARYFIHIVDAIPCYVGFLWPLWDEKKQTFTDKILSTVVVDESRG